MGVIVIMDIVLNFDPLDLIYRHIVHSRPIEITIIEGDLFARGKFIADTGT
jgi:hypothetical protein